MTAPADGNGVAVTGGSVGDWTGSAVGSRTLGGTFNSAGFFVGAVSLPVTTLENGGAGLPGEGVYADVAIDYSVVVLNHAEGSFDGAVDDDVIDIDLGQVFVGSSLPTTGFSIHNIASSAAELDLDAVVGSGDTAALTTDVLAGVTISAGNSNSYSASLSTATIGDFAATWTIENSDFDYSGATDGNDLVINLTGLVTYVGDFEFDLDLDAADIDLMFAQVNGPASDLLYDLTGDSLVTSADTDYLVHTVFNTEYGDANLDGFVDVGDLGILAGSFGGSGTWATADFNGDGAVDVGDLGILAGTFGFDNGSGPVVVPEPATLAMLSLIGMATLRRRK
jgi:hypothetical protein